nr:MAG TPA: hypothetical protein [Caudoviricetes sp.]
MYIRHIRYIVLCIIYIICHVYNIHHNFPFVNSKKVRFTKYLHLLIQI